MLRATVAALIADLERQHEALDLLLCEAEGSGIAEVASLKDGVAERLNRLADWAEERWGR